MPFAEVRPKQTFAYIAEQVIEAVRAGEFKAGDLLPPERDLAQKFRVSRQAVREALAALQLAGVVETRAGLGTFVLAPPQNALQTMWSLEQAESPSEVLEARLLLEPKVAALAAVRATDEDLQHLQQLTGEMKESLNEPDRFGKLDLEFHLLLGRISGNSVLCRFLEAVLGYVNQSLWTSLREEAYRQNLSLASVYMEHHQAILAAMRARNPEEAGRHVRIHLEVAQRIWFGSQE